MSRLLLILITLAIGSCNSAWTAGRENNDFYYNLRVGPTSSVKEDRLESYVDDFIHDFSGMYPPEVLNVARLYSFRFESLPKTVKTLMLGQCRFWSFGVNEMVISPELLNTRALIKAVVYHELGHCLLGLDHDDSREDPSLMSAQIDMADSYYLLNWPKELDKFKKYAKSQIK